MKKGSVSIMRQALFLFLVQLMPMSVLGYDFKSEGVFYSIVYDNVTVTKGDTKYSGDIVIPLSVTNNGKTYKVNRIDNYAFQDSEDITTITINAEIEKIGTGAFSNCKKLSYVYIPEGVTEIGDYAFSGCESLRNIFIPCSVKRTWGHLFEGCKNLQSITFGTKDSDAETIIDGYTFMNCEELRSLILGSNVKSIGLYNFSQVVKLDSIASYSLVPPSVYDRTFLDYLHFEYTDSIYENTTLYVPAEALTAYKTHEIWKKFNHIKAIGDEQLTLTIKYANNGVVKLLPQKGEQYELIIEPDEGWEIHSVSYNGEDVTSQVINGQIFKTPAIIKSSFLTVAFEQAGTAVRELQTGSDVRVTAKHGQIIVTGIMPGEKIDVYSLGGKIVCSEVANATTVSLSVSPQQVYIVNTANKVIKIAL